VTPTARSLAELRKQGYLAQVVEKWIPQARRRQDLFGCIDIVAIKSDLNGVLGVQTTTMVHMSERVKKMILEPSMRVWLQSGNELEVHGWRKMGKKGKRKFWQVETRRIYLSDIK